MAGLGATLTSLLRNCSSIDQITLVFLSANLAKEDKKLISRLLNQNGYLREPKFHDYDAEKLFGHLRSLHGDYTTYGKSLIPDLLPDDKVLYLDSDLVVNVDVLALREFSTHDNPISAVTTSTMPQVLDGTFLMEKLGFPATTKFFNAGVLLFDTKAYNRQNFQQRWKAVSGEHPDDLLCADQTVFNGMCRGSFGILPENFNVGWTPGTDLPQRVVGDSIIHFVGSPKPWDLLGQHLHLGYGLWRGCTPDFWYDAYCRLSSTKLARAWQIRRSITKHALRWRPK